MTLRNGDRAAFSKPISLRAGGAMVFEVLAVRRDGFDGEIELYDGRPSRRRHRERTEDSLPENRSATSSSAPMPPPSAAIPSPPSPDVPRSMARTSPAPAASPRWPGR
jgi:hypothetical protein